ncbi:MAG: hypothetical protein P1U44_00925 [Vicingaceae bacterium]|nr:hypothetical protein [Vicingaceae bacterium]
MYKRQKIADFVSIDTIRFSIIKGIKQVMVAATLPISNMFNVLKVNGCKLILYFIYENISMLNIIIANAVPIAAPKIP